MVFFSVAPPDQSRSCIPAGQDEFLNIVANYRARKRFLVTHRSVDNGPLRTLVGRPTCCGAARQTGLSLRP